MKMSVDDEPERKALDRPLIRPKDEIRAEGTEASSLRSLRLSLSRERELRYQNPAKPGKETREPQADGSSDIGIAWGLRASRASLYSIFSRAERRELPCPFQAFNSCTSSLSICAWNGIPNHA